jgi:hypothetical protein
MPYDTHSQLTTDFGSEKHRQPFVGTYDETLNVAMSISKRRFSLVAIAWQRRFLKQTEQFEHDYDNNNYSDYVEDASVHAED